jgi:transposase
MYSPDLRIRALRLYKAYNSSRRVSKLLGIHHSTICRWYKRIRPLKKIKRNSKFYSKIDSMVKDALIQSPLLTQPQLLVLIQNSFTNIKVSRRTIFESIRRIRFSRKRLKRKLTPHKHPQQDRVESLKFLFNNNDRIFCIDESGFADRQARVTGYSPLGEECVLPPLKQYFQASLILGVDNTGYSKFSFTSKGVKTPDFIDFLHQLELPVGTYIVMDNCAIHKSKKVQEYIHSRRWNLQFLPTYCPDSNPVENLFGIIKRSFRNQLTKSREGISSLVNNLQISTIINSFQHAEKCMKLGK